MTKYILVINAGSATLKFKLFEKQTLKLELSGIVERIGLTKSFLKYKKRGPEKREFYTVKNHQQALILVFKLLSKAGYKIVVVGHRVVHGGEDFIKPTVINKKVLKTLEQYNKLAPLHNPVNIVCIKASQKLLPGVKDVAVFDTAFHSTMPDFAYVYPLPYKFYKQNKIRRYGFHGTSHQFVAREAVKKINKPFKNLKLITCHLGSGCSITAVKNGKVIDTSMGFTPLEGLMMSTRTGSIDPAIPLYLIRELKLRADKVDEVMNKKSGLLGVSGLADMREVLIAAGFNVPGFKSIRKYSKSEKSRAKLALKIFIYTIQKYVGAYTVAMGGLDALVFTAGIGERNTTIRRLVVDGLKFLPKFKVLTIPTNEELMIAKEVKKLVS